MNFALDIPALCESLNWIAAAIAFFGVCFAVGMGIRGRWS